MSYRVKEIFYTLQGEGVHTGRAAVFVRFAGCNLWSGRESDRGFGIGSCSSWCDTDFTGGETAVLWDLVEDILDAWNHNTYSLNRFVVLTGGEPGLQVDYDLCAALQARGFYVAIETNGTCDLPDGIDWICCSPKTGRPLKLKGCDELKVVYPQPTGISPNEYADQISYIWKSVSPLDGDPTSRQACVDFCKQNPGWNLSLQAHKLLGLS